MSDTYMYHGSQRVKVLQTNAVTCVVQIGGNPPYNVNKRELSPDIPALDVTTSDGYASLRKPARLKIETYLMVKINGKELREFSPEELYAVIQAEESTLTALQAIHKKPQALLNEIAERNAALAHLVEEMDKVFA